MPTTPSAVVTTLAALLASGAALAQVSRTPPKPTEFTPGPPIEQPLPFSHKVHVGLGVACLDCHSIEAPGDYAGLPSESKCMACHSAIKADSPHIQKLAQAEQSGRPIDWKRVYRVEEFVYFSHQIHHREAGVECSACHGEVAARDVLHQEKPVSMYFCMKCHDRYQAPNDCELCHDTH